jgi:hypothetical protein
MLRLPLVTGETVLITSVPGIAFTGPDPGEVRVNP